MDGCPQNSDSWRTLWPFLHLPHGPFAAWLRGNRSKITGARLGTQIAALDQVEESMLKMSACVSAAFMAGLISVGCSGSGLKGGGGSAGAGGAVKGGQAGSTMSSGTAGGTGGAIGGSTTDGPIGATGGVADGSGGSIGVGGVGSGGTSGGTGGTISCLPALCSMPACAGDIQPNPDPCGCPICAPPPDAGVAKDAGTRTPLLHRSVGATCPTGRGHGSGPFVDSCSATTCPAYHCVQDLNCTAGTNGRCLTGNPGGLALCSYDECFSDADCPANIPCECRDSASSSAPNSCLAGSDCRVDSDCGPGNFCSPSPAWVNAPYHCHTSSDTCMDDSDCMPLKSCAFDGQNGYWSCVVLPPPPT
jgi:hypothetical protein